MPACQKLLGDRVLREHPLVDLEFPQKDVAIGLMRGLLIVGEQLRHEQPGVGHIALEHFPTLQQRPSSYTQLARLSVHATYTNGTVSNLPHLGKYPAAPFTRGLSCLLVEQSGGLFDAFSELGSVRPRRKARCSLQDARRPLSLEGFPFARGLGKEKPPSERGRLGRGSVFKWRSAVASGTRRRGTPAAGAGRHASPR